MAGFRAARLAADIHRELCLLLRNLKDPRIRDHMVSVVRVQMADDGSFAKVYISAIEGMSTTKLAIEALNSATGRLRRDLANRLHLRKPPQLRFLADDSMEYSAKLNKMMEELREDPS